MNGAVFCDKKINVFYGRSLLFANFSLATKLKYIFIMRKKIKSKTSIKSNDLTVSPTRKDHSDGWPLVFLSSHRIYAIYFNEFFSSIAKWFFSLHSDSLWNVNGVIIWDVFRHFSHVSLCMCTYCKMHDIFGLRLIFTLSTRLQFTLCSPLLIFCTLYYYSLFFFCCSSHIFFPSFPSYLFNVSVSLFFFDGA